MTEGNKLSQSDKALPGSASSCTPPWNAACPRPLVDLTLAVILSVFVLIGSAAAGLLPSAAAHSELISTNPAASSAAATPPQQVSLTFSDDVLPQFATVTLSINDSASRDLTTRVDKSTVIAATTPSAANATQTWKIAYRVVSNDGHPITGTLTFTVTPTPPPPATSTSGSSTAASAPGTTPTPTTTTAQPASPGSRINYPLAIIPVAVLALAALGPALVAARRRKQATSGRPDADEQAQ